MNKAAVEDLLALAEFLGEFAAVGRWRTDREHDLEAGKP
jgi:hypothetical protein